jgi:hypothetical protein|tara:strand:- start:19 stop:138 length:120 start_codon:yes stop_codon:yes gene_type:complete
LFEFFAKEKYRVVDPSFTRGGDGIGKGPAYQDKVGTTGY